MGGLVLLAIGCAAVWLVSFGLLYAVANRTGDLQQQLNILEQSGPEK